MVDCVGFIIIRLATPLLSILQDQNAHSTILYGNPSSQTTEAVSIGETIMVAAFYVSH